MLYMEIIANSFNNRTEHSNILCRQNAELIVLNLAAPLDFKMLSSASIVTSRIVM
jgi:hypothetical protein